jgi:hypothetical protein
VDEDGFEIKDGGGYKVEDEGGFKVPLLGNLTLQSHISPYHALILLRLAAID